MSSAVVEGGVGMTASMLEPLVTAVTDNIAMVLPVGITIFGIMIGIGLIPKIVKQFKKS